MTHNGDHDCAADCLGIKRAAGDFNEVEGDGLVGVFPAGPPTTNVIAGVVDFHVHSGPDAFGRALDDDETASVAVRAQMGGVVFKNHIAETASRAVLARKRSGNVEIYGGIVLNRAVGGLNEDAVRWMARIEGGRGRVVWLPTIDAGNHLRFLGGGREGLEVVREGSPTDEVVRVFRACAENRLVLHTGHTAADDCLVLAELARERDVRLCVTHGMFPIVGFDVPRMRQVAELGAKIELCAIGMFMGEHAQHEWMRAWGKVSAEACARAVREIGAEHFVLSTDLGQFGNPTPPDGYRGFVDALLGTGISLEEIDLMARRTPLALLTRS